MSLANVTVWAVKQGSDQMYYNKITVSPNQPFILSVDVCPSVTAFWNVTLNLLKPDESPLNSDWLRSKGHTVSAGSCMRADFPLEFPQSGKIKIIVSYIDSEGNYHEVWTGWFEVDVMEMPRVTFEDSVLVYGGRTYQPNAVVNVEKGGVVEVKSTVISSRPAEITLELYDEYNDRSITSKEVYISGAAQEVLQFTVEEYERAVLRAKYGEHIVGVDGSWTVNVVEKTPSPSPTQPSHPTQPSRPSQPTHKEQPTKEQWKIPEIRPLEAAAIGLLAGSVIVLLVGGHNG